MTSSPRRVEDLEINQDLAVQGKTWTYQRIGWAGMALTILAALAGLFGSGPVSRSMVTDEQQLVRLEYDRFGRYEAESVLQLFVPSEVTMNGYVTLWIDRIYWAHHAIEQIAPEPIASRSSSSLRIRWSAAPTIMAGVVRGASLVTPRT